MTIEPTLHCPCGEGSLSPAFRYDEAPSGETPFPLGDVPYRRRFDRCSVCDHWFGCHDLPIERLYDDAYVDATYGGIDGMVDRLERVLELPPARSDNAARVARVTAFVQEQRARTGCSDGSADRLRALDVGAGIGVFPAGLLGAGWDVVAVEPDPRTVHMLSTRLGIRAEARDLLELTHRDLGVFTAVTFNKVLEHVEDPVRLLAHAAEFLDRDGFCYVEVPDVAAATAGPGREEFFIEHHHVFSPTSLAMLGERAGFRVVRVERLVEPSGKFTLFAFMSSG